MKIDRITKQLQAVVSIGALLTLFTLSSCHGKANMEDDTFRESIVDDPGRHYRKTVEKDKRDSLNHRDSTKTKENVTY